MSKLRPKVPFKKEEQKNTDLFVSSLAELTQQRKWRKDARMNPIAHLKFILHAQESIQIYHNGLVKKYQ
jgi:hypothetical protein